MAKRITDFFRVSSKKQKSSNPEYYILPQNLPAETSNSNTSFTINQVEPVEGIVDCPPLLHRVHHLHFLQLSPSRYHFMFLIRTALIQNNQVIIL
ncbi:unnamed protein product [Macrosiphum euphorbiae]|uniref:Uncharacterized protein n=1 Tax=Macrosiphum euphorbiae TaxID=13131 RepID=A0AAV0VV80_9HEMI|nr:unnamed protein product [Macrosiphum euphorbiae]